MQTRPSASQTHTHPLKSTLTPTNTSLHRHLCTYTKQLFAKTFRSRKEENSMLITTQEVVISVVSLHSVKKITNKTISIRQQHLKVFRFLGVSIFFLNLFYQRWRIKSWINALYFVQSTWGALVGDTEQAAAYKHSYCLRSSEQRSHLLLSG